MHQNAQQDQGALPSGDREGFDEAACGAPEAGFPEFDDSTGSNGRTPRADGQRDDRRHGGRSASGSDGRQADRGHPGGQPGRGSPGGYGPRGPDAGEPYDRGGIYGALDLGTNNCRLLMARPSRRGFRVVDAFSRIIRLGEGVSQTGRLSDEAMSRTIEALKVCAGKLERRDVTRARCVATEACRIAMNGQEFLDRVKRDTGLEIEVLTREDEAGLAVAGCASLIDNRADYVLVFDIGGGSSELIWLDLKDSQVRDGGGRPGSHKITAWTSLPAGVVTLAERFGGRHVTEDSFEAMVRHVEDLIHPFEKEHGFRGRTDGTPVHFLGTSGTVTTVAGIRLGLERYDRTRVDGCWLDVGEVRDVTSGLLARTYDQRVAEPCIGPERADLVLAGCAILEALMRAWSCERLRVADRGLREGILTKLMTEDGVYRAGRRRRSRYRKG